MVEHISAAIHCRQTNRYQTPIGGTEQDHNQLLQAETAFAEYIGTQYCLGVNSGGTALKLILEGLKSRVESNIVYTNSFTFNAVPSSIVNAGMEPRLIECTKNLVIDLEDLEKEIQETGGKILMLSYMRGFIPDLEKVQKICETYGVLLVEDAAHAYGIQYKGKMVGSFGIATGVSTQSNKLINTGEGGFILTNDEDLMARSIISAGSYEKYWMKHGKMTPSKWAIDKYIKSVPNQSVRMSNVQGAMALAQFGNIEERIDMLNANHGLLQKYLGNIAEVIKQQAFVTRPVYDSIQIRIAGLPKKRAEEIQKVVQQKFKFQLFLHEDNARYFKSWKFMDCKEKALPMTEESLQNVFDMRIKHTANQTELNAIAETIILALRHSNYLP